MNKKLFFLAFLFVFRYCSHVTKIMRFGISHKGGFLCLVCQMCQILTFDTSAVNALRNPKTKLISSYMHLDKNFLDCIYLD